MTGFLRIGGHNKVRARLSSYIDGQLTAGEAARIEAHLTDCGACRNELDSLRMTVRLLNELPLLEPPRSLALESAPAPAPSFTGRLWAARLATSAMAALLAALIAGDVTGVLVSTKPEAEAIEVEAAAESALEMDAPVPASAAAPAPAPQRAAVMKDAPAAAAPAPKPAPAIARADAMAEKAIETTEEASVDEAPQLGAETAPALAAAPEASPIQTAAIESAQAARAGPGDEAGPSPEPEAVSALTTQEFPDPEAAQETPQPASEAAPALAAAPDQEGAAAVTLEPAKAVTEAPAPAAISLPLRQLQIAAGALLILLSTATVWLTRRLRGEAK